MSDRDERPAAQDPSRLLPAGVETDPSRLLESGSETDTSKLLPAHTGQGDWEHAEKQPHHYPPHHPAHHPKHTARWLLGALALTALYFSGLAIHDRLQERRYAAALASRMTGGDPERGRGLVRSHGCAQCHTVPGVPGANGQVGPPLAGIASRVYVGGVVTNTPDHMVRWIMNPKAIDPRTAMPNLGIPEEQARDIAAYLYTLR